MPRSQYKKKKVKGGRIMYFRNGKLISKASYNRGISSRRASGKRKVRKTKLKRRKTMAKRGNGSSYSKQNIAIGTLLAQVAPKVAPQVAGFLPLVAVLPKAPVALKVMGWGMASKVVSDSFLNR
jgi:hypothetical protein